MDEETIRNYLRQIIGCRKISFFVIASDEFKLIDINRINFPVIIVANCEKRGQLGSHWISFWVGKKVKGRKRHIIYFDSFGNHFRKYKLQPNFEIQEINYKSLQDQNSDLCGNYAIFFSFLKIRNYSLKRILQKFSNDTIRNDRIVTTFFNQTLKYKIESCRRKTGILSCKPRCIVECRTNGINSKCVS